MKFKSLPLLTCLALGLAFLSAPAHEDHDHAVKRTAGPNGGRILTGLQPRAEFYINADRKVQITFLDDQGRPVAPTGQIVVVTAGNRAAPTRLTFNPAGNALLSNALFPAGSLVPTVVQITPAPGDRIVTAKFNVDLSVCPDCQHAEYACTCEGH